MAVLQLQSQIFPNFRWPGVDVAHPPHIHIYVSQDFTTADGLRLTYGGPGSGGPAYQPIVCSIDSSANVTMPAFTLESTRDGLDYKNASYSFYWYKSNDSALIAPMAGLTNIQVPATIISDRSCSPAGLCCFLEDLIIFNQGAPAQPLDSFYTKSQVDAKIAANLVSGAPASATYIVQTATGALTNAQALSALATGILKSTTGTGVLSIAVGDTDYQKPIGVTAPITLTTDNIGVQSSALAVGTGIQITAGTGTGSLLTSTGVTLAVTTAVPTSVVNDTNVTGSIAANALTLGWTGTLAAGRLNTNVVQSIVNDTNIQGSIAAQALTLAWAGTLAKGRTLATTVYTDQTNVFGAFLQDFTSATLKVPNGAGLAPTTSALIAYDTTANRFNGGVNGANKLFVTPDSTDTFTNKTWNGVVIGTQYGGLGANESAASGVLSLNAGAVVNNAVTQNGIAFGGASSALTFTAATANAVLVTSAGNVPSLSAPGVSLTVSGSVLNTIQNIRTTDTPQWAGAGLNQAASAVTILGITGPTITTQADQSVGSLQTGLNLTKNDGNTRTFFDTLIKPTINTGAGNSATTLNVLTVDTINTVVTGVTTNLLRVNYGGVNQLNLTSGGALTVATSLAIAGGTALTTTNQTGTGNLVLATSPTLVTPALGVATATTINGLTITTSTGTLTIANGKTATINNTLTFAGTDATTVTFTKGPTFNNAITFAGTDATTMTFPSSSDTVVTLAASQTLTNKTLGATTTVTGPVTMTLGSDATGDIYYRNSSGILTRLAVGSGTQFIGVSGGIPTWATPAGTGGTISSASTNQLAFYTAATTISGNTGITTDASNDFFVAPTAQTSGSPNIFTVTGPAHTTLASGLEDTDVRFALSRTVQFTGSAVAHANDIATVRAIRMDPVTYSFSSSANQTIFSSATLAVTGTPALGSNNVTAVTSGTAMIWAQQGSTSLNINNQTGPFTISIAATGSYADSTGGNIFQIGSNVINTGTRPTVGVFGGARGDGSGASVWGGNFVGYSNFAGSVASRALELDFGNLIANASATSFGIAFSIFGGNATNAPVMQITQGAGGSVALSALRINGSGGTPIVSTGSVIDSTGGPSFAYGIDANGMTLSGAVIRAAYGQTAASSRNQAAGADIPLIQLGTLNSTNTLLLAPAATITTTVAPAGQLWYGATSIGNVVAGQGVIGFQPSDTIAAVLSVASVGQSATVRTYRADGASNTGFTAIQSADVLGSFQTQGYDGSVFGLACYACRTVAAETWGASAHGAYQQFATTPTGTTSPTEVLRLQANGGLQLNLVTTAPATGDFISAANNSVIAYMSKVTAGRLVFAVNNAGTIEYLFITINGSGVTWGAQAGGTAP